MDQQIRNADNRIIFIFTDLNIDGRSVLFDHNAMKRHLTGYPLIIFDSAIIVSIRIRKSSFFIKGVLLQIQSGRINMGTNDVHAVFERLITNNEHQDRFPHLVDIDPVSGLQRLSGCNCFFQRHISVLFSFFDDIGNIFPYLISVVVLRLALAIPGTIASETTLAYLGLISVETPSLGILLRNARSLFMRYPYMLVFPAVIVSLITITFYLVGNAFSDACDPRNHM